jgi:hypothetical protein
MCFEGAIECRSCSMDDEKIVDSEFKMAVAKIKANKQQ